MIIPSESVDKPDYRFKRGSKLADFPPVHPNVAVPPLSSFDGPFQLAEYLTLKVRNDPHDIKGLVDVPSDNAKAADKHVWIYEHLRRIPIDATPLITHLLQMCSRKTCPEMKADEWQYLCVAHGGDSTDRCCAIDYILHAVDSTTALLNSSNYFPSRLQIPHASLAHFPSLFRRLSRIFSHAYFHHREAFATAEAETSLYARFVALCEKYELVSSNLLIIPQSGYEVTVMRDEDDDYKDESNWDDDDEDHEEEDNDGEGEGEGEEKVHEKQEAKEATEPKEAKEGEGGTPPPSDREIPEGAMSPREDALRATHSLGRYQSPGKWATSPVQPATKGKPAPAHTTESLSPPSTRASLAEYDGDSSPPAPSNLQGKGKRGTLSRGKAPRGANVWAAEKSDDATDAVPPLPSGIGMARKESVESVVFVGKEEEEGDDEDEAQLPSLSDEEKKPEPKVEDNKDPADRPSEPVTIPAPARAPAPGSPSASTRTALAAPTAEALSPTSPPKGSPTPKSRLGASPKSVLAALPERNLDVPPKENPSSKTVPAPTLESAVLPDDNAKPASPRSPRSPPVLATSPPAKTSPLVSPTIVPVIAQSQQSSSNTSTLGTSPTAQSTLSTSPTTQSTLGTTQSTLGTSPRSELQARGDGRDQLAVSPRGGTGGRRGGGGRKSRVPRSPGKKPRNGNDGQKTPSTE